MPESPGLVPGLIIVGVLVVLAVVFGVRQWLDRRGRDSALSEADARYFARQDARRLAGSSLMLLIAAGMTAGLALNPRADRATGQLWGLIWLGVGVLVIVLLLIGMIDWLELRTYADRHRRALDAERRATIEAERRRLNQEAQAAQNPGTTDGPPAV